MRLHCLLRLARRNLSHHMCSSKSQRTRHGHSEPDTVRKPPCLATATTSSRCRVPVHDTTTNHAKTRSGVTLQQTETQNKHLEVHRVHEVDVPDVVDLSRKETLPNTVQAYPHLRLRPNMRRCAVTMRHEACYKEICAGMFTLCVTNTVVLKPSEAGT